MLMRIAHPCRNLLGPFHQLLRRNLLSLSQKVEERSIRTILHDDTENRCLGANTAELYNVWVVELAQVLDLDLVLLLDLLDRDSFPFVLANKDCPLGSRAQAFQIGDVLKWDLPVILFNL